MHRFQAAILFSVLAILASACSGNVREIPAGYVGRILTPTGWQDTILEAGQVDLGVKNNNGTYNTLTLLEATSTTVKEQFLQADSKEGATDKEDHRVVTQDGVPLSVDVYIRAIAPDDQKARNNVFVQVTPADTKDGLVKIISVQNVYDRFARQDVRSKIRGIFANYKDYKSAYSNFNGISEELGRVIDETFKRTGVPLKLQNVSLSNVKPDETVWSAQNRNAAAASEAANIEMVGSALRANPQYEGYMKWQALQTIAREGSVKGTNTIIITDSATGSMASSIAAVETLRPQLTPQR